jgi:hypothetical protein
MYRLTSILSKSRKEEEVKVWLSVYLSNDLIDCWDPNRSIYPFHADRMMMMISKRES